MAKTLKSKRSCYGCSTSRCPVILKVDKIDIHEIVMKCNKWNDETRLI